MDYLRWSKLHRRTRFELTVSGVPQATWSDLGPELPPIDLIVTGSFGHPALIEAIASRYRIAPECVVPVPGASSANFIALTIAANRGDRVLLEHPIYQPMLRVAEFLGLELVWLKREPDANFAVDAEQIEASLARGVRAVVLTNLHNPSGQYITPATMADIANVCERAGAILVVDEVYLDSVHLNAGRPLWTAAHYGPHVIAINSLTKVYGLAGLRAGWILVSPALAERARTMMDLLSVNNAAPAESIALHGFQHIRMLEDRFRRFHQDVRAVFDDWLRSEPLVHAYPNHGALYDCLRLPHQITGNRLNDLLVADYDTQVVPGAFFELPDHIRLTPAALKPADLSEALTRINRALRQLV